MLPPPPPPRPALAPFVLVALAAALLGMGASALVLGRAAPPAAPSVVVRPTPDVLIAIRDLSKLESVSFHMERVIDLADKQDRLFGLVHAEDAILLVAAADVVAGIDLEKLRAESVFVQPAQRSVKIILPPAEILSSRIDGDRTYVHTRKTGILADRKESLETDARREAERSLREAAIAAGILPRAQANAAKTVESLVRQLGYEHIEIATH